MTARQTSYAQKLKDPRWQKKRLAILGRDDWTCQICFSNEKTLHVHHLYYPPGCEPWEASDDHLVTLCEDCHEDETVARKEAMEQLKETLAIHKFHADDILALVSLIFAIGAVNGHGPRFGQCFDLEAIAHHIRQPMNMENLWGGFQNSNSQTAGGA